eukprot:NODE_4805_length_626_cov_56.831889_g4135_i0.p1 GENE.NODE_4805_length_626_cov_56.831889_g4135_i0~~NODE_4805_length_626_cov_56.831889_g4135_i0.p1  ORF type:complete len:173 (+),score=48.09 NODE_4805_length_626_cov_56.831889_g4135_i0:29-547(+)
MGIKKIMQLVELVAEKTGKPKAQVLQYSLALMVAFVIFGVGASIITNIVGVAYPVFMSFIALESEGADDDKMWLTYWVVFGAFSILDSITGIILRFIPFYYVLKLAFLIWCFHPSSVGSLSIYNNFILPFFEEHKHKVEEAQKKMQEAAQDAYNKSQEFVRQKTGEIAGNEN